MAYPKPSELWEMGSEEFNQWRRENDLKSLFEFFRERLPFFEEWLTANQLTIPIILETDMPGQFFHWNKPTYMAKTTKEESISYFFVPVESEKHEKRILANQKITYNHEKTEWLRFIPYFLWVKTEHKIDKPIKSGHSGELDTFRFVLRNAPDVPESCSASIAPGFPVLKLGGTKIDGWHRINYRNLDFTNLDYLQIEGKDTWNREIRISFSSCQNITCKNVVANFTQFYQCDFFNLKVIDSRFYGIQFYECNLFTVYFENSSISNLAIVNGSANHFSFNRVEVEDIYYIPPTKEYHCEVVGTYETVTDNYKRFRILYQSNGLRHEASESYYKERFYELKYTWANLKFLQSLWRLRKGNFDFTLPAIKEQFNNLVKVIADFISYLIWGFGERPLRIVMSSLIVLTCYAFIYYCSDINKLQSDMINSYYLSIVTFTTLGFGDITPLGNNTYKLIVGSEALLGAFCMGLLVAGYANKSRY